MSLYADDDLTNWMATMASLRPKVAKSMALESAARDVARELYDSYATTTALARVYAVMPYSELEASVKAFVDQLVEGAGEQASLTATTPVLVLLGTHGAKPEWRDRLTSRGHRGIPLLSSTFVSAIPMVARLLKELGLDLAWLDAAPDQRARRLLGGANGIFYVDDAASARDGEGRLVIPAQDFVAEQKVKTVFGMGGLYPDGTLVAIIVFAREYLARVQVERLTSLIALFKGETAEVVSSRKLFAT